LQYTKVAVKYADKIKHQIAFKIAENKIGFDGNYLTEVLISLLKLGHEKVWVHYTNPNRAFIFTVKQEYELGNDEIVLLMPLNLTEGQQERLQTGISFGTLDADSNRQLSVYYDFATDEIYNADGSIAEFKMNYKNNVVIPEEDVKLLKKLTTEKRHSNNSMLVQVENKTALAVSDELRDYIRLKDIDLSAGLYNVVDAVLEPTMTPVEDYPEVPSFVEDENTIELTIDSEVLEYYFDKLKLAVSKDDLRPVMKGILLHYTTDHRLYLVATDAHIMLKIELTDYVEMRKYDFEAKYILNPKYINMFLDNVENHSLFISSNRKATLIESAKADLYSENIVGNYPNYNGVIPYFLDKKITFNLSDIKKCINGEKVKSYTKSNGSKYSADVIFNDGNKLKIGHSASVTGGVIENVEDLCDIDFNVSNEEYQYRNDSVLLSMPFLDRSKEYDFAFNKGNLTRITDIIVDEKVEMHYIDDNKPYIIPIHSISFDKTQKTSKKKEQKPTQKEIDRVIEEDRIQQEHNELGDAIDILHLLSDSASDEERAEINEALEILEMLQEEAPIFEEGGSIEPLNELSYVSNEFGNTTIDTPLETLK
jgi:DNA polymerase III sliding clamp (beta) subunit (PCNA family)